MLGIESAGLQVGMTHITKTSKARSDAHNEVLAAVTAVRRGVRLHVIAVSCIPAATHAVAHWLQELQEL